MIWGSYKDLTYAIKRLKAFRNEFHADGPFTATTAGGRNFALFYDFGNEGDEPENGDYLSCFVLCAGWGKLLADKCDQFRIKERPDIQAEIASWWWRANQVVNWARLQ